MLILIASLQIALGADISSDRIALGIFEDGSLVNSTQTLGMLWDSDAQGTTPLGADFILAGNPYEVWSTSYTVGGINQNIVSGGPYLSGGEPLIFSSITTNDTMTWLSAESEVPGLEMYFEWEIPWGKDFAWLSITAHATSPVSDLWIARIVDSDQEASDYETYNTINIAQGATFLAAPIFGERHLALSAHNGIAGIGTWMELPEDVVNGDSNVTGDKTGGVAVLLGDLAPGEQATATFVYAFGLDAESTVSLAETAAASTDHDEDGEDRPMDCNDHDNTVSTSSLEIADGIDNDCDGVIDEDTTISDDDGDGYSEVDGDCDDQNPAVHPDADPIKGIADADCDGVADDGMFGLHDTGNTEDTGDTGVLDLDTGTENTEAIGLVSGGCTGGCSTSSTYNTSAGLILFALIGLFRRRTIPVAAALLLGGCASDEGITTTTTTTTTTTIPTTATTATTASTTTPSVSLTANEGTVLDPKMDDAFLTFEFITDRDCDLEVVATAPTGEIATLTSATVDTKPTTITWDGWADDDLPFDPGPFEIQATCDDAFALLSGYIVRLGPSSVNFTGLNGDGTNGHVTLAYHKTSLSERGVTILEESLPEYQSEAGTYDLADLDNNDGTPRGAIDAWSNPNQPPWGGEQPNGPHNVPTGFVAGSDVHLVVTPGTHAASGRRGTAVPAFGFPGRAINAPLVRVTSDDLLETSTWLPEQGFSTTLSLPTADVVGRQDISIHWQFEASWDDVTWLPVPGSFITEHPFYSLVSEPVLIDGTDIGASPAVPWIGVLEEVSESINGVEASSFLVLDALRGHIYDDDYITYDPGDGAYSGYAGGYIYWYDEWFYMSDWLDRSEGVNLYCHSVACLLSALAGTVGIDAPYLVLSGQSFDTSLTLAAGTTEWATWYFNSHGVIEHDGHVWDAAIDIDGDENPTEMPVSPVAPLGIPTDDYIDLLTVDNIWVVNDGYCKVY